MRWDAELVGIESFRESWKYSFAKLALNSPVDFHQHLRDLANIGDSNRRKREVKVIERANTLMSKFGVRSLDIVELGGGWPGPSTSGRLQRISYTRIIFIIQETLFRRWPILE